MVNKNFTAYIKTTLVVMIFTFLMFCLPSPISFICEALAVAYFAKIALKFHYRYVIATGAIVLAIAAASGGVIAVLISGVSIILLSVSLGIGTRLGVSFYKLLCLCAALYLTSTVAGIVLVKNMSPDIFSLEYFYETFNNVLENMSQTGYAISPEMLDTLNGYLKASVLFMMKITPAMMIISATFCAYILMQVYKIVLIKAKEDTSHIVPFDKMRTKRQSGIVFILLFFLYSAAPEGLFSDLSLNVLIILGFMFFACGFSLFDWTMKMRGRKKSTRRLIEIAILPISYMFMFMPVIALTVYGLIDSFFNFRNRVVNKQD